jgi:hypothetical protein
VQNAETAVVELLTKIVSSFSTELSTTNVEKYCRTVPIPYAQENNRQKESRPNGAAWFLKARS